eukprot:TRINITY_DN89173_c0_g1_i1.p1 TRINITY_DN89173_c0_g1~~TRINITY_DN89173_c0_g1_i1.p1  ORF type:complete len:330 (+),score=42.54 TRINITY_DN89173_c0_g1_i1:164-1153(+)
MGQSKCCFGFLWQSPHPFEGQRLHHSSRAEAQLKVHQGKHLDAEVVPVRTLRLSPDAELQVMVQDISTSSVDGVSHFSSGSDNRPDSTGACVWWGGLLLSAWISHEKADFIRGQRIIELGCGASALPSAAASMCGAAVALATDGCPANIGAARSTISCNEAVLKSCSAMKFDWADGVAEADLAAWDVVLFADVLYKAGTSELLARTIAQLLRPGGMVLGAVGLHRVGSSEIFGAMKCQGFDAQEIPLTAPVLESTKGASMSLAGVAGHDSLAVMGLSASRNESILVRWIHTGICVQGSADMSETLCGKVLNATRAPEESTCDSGWMPSE